MREDEGGGLPPASRGRTPITADQLARYLFGDPLDPRDVGVVGRLMAQVDVNSRLVTRILRLGWGLLVVFVAAVLTLAVDAVIRASESHP